MKKAINKNVKRATALALSFTMVFGLALTSYAEGEYNVHDEISEAEIIADNAPEGWYVEELSVDDMAERPIPIEAKMPISLDGIYQEGQTGFEGENASGSDSGEGEVVLSNEYRPGAIQLNEDALVSLDILATSVSGAADSQNPTMVFSIHQSAINGLSESLGEEGVDKLLKDTKDNLSNLDGYITDAEDLEKSADGKVAGVISSNKDAIAAANNIASGKADSAKANAAAANSASTLDDATAAKAAAETDLAAAQAGLADATAAYNTASANLEKVSEDLKAAEDEYGKAAAKLKAAKDELEKAEGNSADALEKLKAAEKQMADLDKEVKDLQNSEADLKAIQNQQYALMLQYFREAKAAVYNADYPKEGETEAGRTLNIEASADNIDKDTINKKAKSISNEELYIGRYLMKLLVEYMINNDENVDPATANITWGSDNASGKGTGYEAIVFASDSEGKDANGNKVEHVQQVAAGKDRGVYGGSRTGIGERFDYNFTKSVNNGKNGKEDDWGRSNHVLVKYTDKDNKEHSLYFNYIFKSEKDKSDISNEDIKDGIVYLAAVQQDGGVWSSEAVTEENTGLDTSNDYSSYSKLIKALELASKANELIEQYDQALAAVQAAEARTQDLVDQIAKIKITDLAEKSVKLEELKDALKKANEELDKAKEDKTNIEDKIKEVQKAIDEIDLTRFDVVTNDEPTNDDTAEGNDPQTPAGQNPGQGQGGAGQQNANIDGQQGQADQDGNADLIIDDENSATAASVKVADDEGATRPSFTITDEASATAASVEEAGANLWWLLLLLLLALMIAFAIYKYAENKRNAEIND